MLGRERLTGALLDRLTHRVHILEMNGASYRFKDSVPLRILVSIQCPFVVEKYQKRSKHIKLLGMCNSI